MKKNFALITAILAVLILTGCPAADNDLSERGSVNTFTFSSSALEENLIGESTSKSIMVYLPYGYESSDKNYPVIYYLAGFGGNSHEIITGSSITSGSEGSRAIDRAIENEVISECIVVGISGINRLGGSFYVNSPVIGNWEDYILEVVNQVDTRYRTVNTASSRGLSGFSMGGFGAVNLGLRNPDVFGYVYAFSPGLFGEDGFDAEVWGSWSGWGSVLNSYGAAFDYDLTLDASPYANTPSSSLTPSAAVEGWKESWSTGYGDAEGKIEYYKTKNIPLLGIKIDYAQNDRFSWLIEGSRFFYQKFVEAGINAQQDEVSGYGHNIDGLIVEDYLLTYFGNAFR